MTEPAFKPAVVGTPYVGSKQQAAERAQQERFSRYAGLGVGGLSMLTAYLLSNKKQSRLRRLLKALGVGAAAGGLTYTGMRGWNLYNGRSYRKDYRSPEDILAEYTKNGGKGPIDLNVYIAGAGSGVGNSHNGIRVHDMEYGKDRTLVVNRKDMPYLQTYLRQAAKIWPEYRFNITGHSQGGYEAYRLARWAERNGIKLNKLTTEDPVFRFGRMEGKPSTTKEWVNYYPSQREWKFLPDLYALLGGAHNELKGADNRKVSESTFNDHSSIAEYPYYENGRNAFKQTPSVSDWPEQWWVPSRLSALLGNKK